MAQASILQDGIDRFENTFRNLEKDWKRLQKRAEKQRKDLEKRAEKQVKKLRTQLDKNPVVKRAQNLRTDAVKTIEDGVDQILGTMRVAPHSEIKRLERKVNSLSRKVRQLENEAA